MDTSYFNRSTIESGKSVYGRARLRVSGWRLGLLGLLLALLSLLFATSAMAESRVVLGQYGEAGVGAGQLGAGPADIAVNRTGAGGVAAGTIYVVDAANRRIMRWQPNGDSADFVSTWGWNVVASGEDDTSPVNGFEICKANPPSNDVCQAGTASTGAGGFGNRPLGIALDQSTGNVYVSDVSNRRIAVYSATGAFQGAFGWGVRAGSVAPFSLEFCTTSSGCQAGQAGEAGGQLGVTNRGSGLAVDQSNGHLYFANTANGRVDEYAPELDGSGQVTGVAFVRAFGWDVVAGGSTQFEVCTPTDTCKKALPGGQPGQFSEADTNAGGVSSVAIGADGAIYAVDVPRPTFPCNTTTHKCRVQRFESGTLAVEDFAPAAFSTSMPPKAIAVDQDTGRVFVVQQSTPNFRVLEFDAVGADEPEPSPPASFITGTNAFWGVVAVGNGGRLDVLQPNERRVLVMGSVPAPGAEMTGVEDVTTDAATFKGDVTVPAPGGEGFSTRYQFEYSSNGSKWTAVPSLAKSVGDVAGAFSVQQSVAGLSPNTEYLVRLKACTTSCTISQQALEFTTDSAAPAVEMTFPDEVTETSAILGGHVNPNGERTSYQIEWGENGVYVGRVPAFERSIGSGTKAVIIREAITGLRPGGQYHFRIVATNPTGTTIGPEQEFSTLNACGLTRDRCFELVSPADKGPVGEVGETILGGSQLRFRPAAVGDSVAYLLGWGLPDARTGGEVVYEAVRGQDGWSSAQLSAPSIIPPYLTGTGSGTDQIQYLADNLQCAIVSSNQPLTQDAPWETINAGKSNLFVRSASGAYTVITDQVPANLAAISSTSTYKTIGASEDCSRVVFTSVFTYPGAGGVKLNPLDPILYEWSEGEIKAVALVEGPTGPVYVGDEEAGAGPANFRTAVSGDGERIVFTATSQAGGDVGKRAVFLKEGDGPARKVSAKASDGTAENEGASFQMATPNGDHIFFLANYGLTAESSSGMASCSAGDGAADSGTGAGCDLYRYDVSSGELSNLSAVNDPANPVGAGVVGVLDISDDGTKVYFAARAQLVHGVGKSYAENVSGQGSYNVYLSDEGELSFVGEVAERDVQSGSTLAPATGANVTVWQSTLGASTASSATPDGNRLLFQSSADVTGYHSGGSVEAYLYDAGTGKRACVSCRRDGEPSVGGATGQPPLASTLAHSFPDVLHPPLTMSRDGSQVYFSKLDALAHGAVEGRVNLYLWEEGQVSLLASGWPGIQQREGAKGQLAFAGASADGRSIYLSTPEPLVLADRDERQDLYVARSGGGFPDPVPSPPPCDPLSEDACQGPGAGGEAGTTPPGSASLAGPGNQRQAGKAKKKKKRARSHRRGNKRKVGKKGRGKKSAGKRHKGRQGKRSHKNRGAAR